MRACISFIRYAKALKDFYYLTCAVVIVDKEEIKMEKKIWEKNLLNLEDENFHYLKNLQSMEN